MKIYEKKTQNKKNTTFLKKQIKLFTQYEFQA